MFSLAVRTSSQGREGATACRPDRPGWLSSLQRQAAGRRPQGLPRYRRRSEALFHQWQSARLCRTQQQTAVESVALDRGCVWPQEPAADLQRASFPPGSLPRLRVTQTQSLN
jgi:hypothetical protein